MSDSGRDMTPAEQAELARRFEEALRHGRPRLLTPLPRRVRLRLAATRIIDHTAIRLASIGDGRAAVWLWRAFGMWSR